ncbi:MAG: hypothetical protein NTV22_00340 [bacterium]|nr:hypothetical protein [bacterium]
MNEQGTFSRQALSIGDFFTGNWDAAARNSSQAILDGACAPGWAYWGHYGALGVSAAAALAAATLIGAEAAGITDIGSAQIGWKGGEITFTQVGKATPNFRVNLSKLHYHRRPDIGKHRPWEGGW